MSDKTLQREPELASQLPAEAPSHLHHLLQQLDEGIKLDAPATAARTLRETLGFMLAYFTDLVCAASLHFGGSAELFGPTEDKSLAAAEDRLREGLNFLNQRIQVQPLARTLMRVFYDLGSNEPRDHYTLTQGTAKSPRVSELCKVVDTNRKSALKARQTYLPYLVDWLREAKPFWEGSKLLWEFTTPEGRQEVAHEYDGIQVMGGPTCDLKGCPACIPTRNLIIPSSLAGEEYRLGVPQGVPEHTLHLIDRLDEHVLADDAVAATRLLRDTLEFLLRYFAGVAVTLCRELDAFPASAQKYTENYQLVDNCERLAHLCVEALKDHPDDPGARPLVGVFFRRNELFEFLPRAHTRVLLLEDVLSSWFKTERGGVVPTEQSSRKDFERFFPLLRDWLTAMGAYFTKTEHFEEPPSKDGKLPLTVKLADHLLELLEPGYILKIRQCPVCLPDPIWLTQPRPAATAGAEPSVIAEEVTAAEAPAAPAEVSGVVRGEFHRLKTPRRAPRFLERVLKRLDVHLQRDEMALTWMALRDALDYLVRYWGGVSALAARHLEVLSAAQEDLADSSLDVEQCERLLISTLESLLQKPDDALTQEIRSVFFERDEFSEQDRPMGSHAAMLAMDADPGNKMQLLSEFCAREPQKDPHKCRREVKTFLPVVRDWLERCERFFEQCEHHEESPDPYDGRMELVVQFDQTYLELISPDYVFYVRPESDVVPELEVPEYIEPQPEEAELPAEEAKQRQLSAEEKAMLEPFLLHRVAYIGKQNNSSGVVCKSGIIHIKNAGGGTLSGTAFTTHPCLEVSPRRFKDNSQLTYWLNEAEVPRDYSPVIILRSGNDERQVTLNELRPLSPLSRVNEYQAKMLLIAPAVLGVALFSLLLLLVSREAWPLLKSLPAGNLRQDAPAELDMLIWKGQPVGWFFLILSIGAPWLTYYVYNKLPPTLQDMCNWDMRRAAALPSIIVTVLIVLPILRQPLTSHPDIQTLNLMRLLPWFMFFNAGFVGYIYLDQSQKLAEWIEEPVFRKLVPVVLFAIFIMCATLALL